MNNDNLISLIKQKFLLSGKQVEIPLQKGGCFRAELVEGGIIVDNLGAQPFLPWIVFQETIKLLNQNGGSAYRGDAMNSRLGDMGLPLDSIEGHIAYKIYEKRIGDTVFRRITPIACILKWVGICDYRPGKLVLH
jgi:hypothetical protein